MCSSWKKRSERSWIVSNFHSDVYSRAVLLHEVPAVCESLMIRADQSARKQNRSVSGRRRARRRYGGAVSADRGLDSDAGAGKRGRIFRADGGIV